MTKLTNDEINQIIEIVKNYPDNRDKKGLCWALGHMLGDVWDVKFIDYGIQLPPAGYGINFLTDDFAYCWPTNKAGDVDRIKFLEALKSPE